MRGIATTYTEHVSITCGKRAEIGPNQGLATTYTEHVSITRGIANNPYWKPDPTVAPCQPFASPP